MPSDYDTDMVEHYVMYTLIVLVLTVGIRMSHPDILIPTYLLTVQYTCPCVSLVS